MSIIFKGGLCDILISICRYLFNCMQCCWDSGLVGVDSQFQSQTLSLSGSRKRNDTLFHATRKIVSTAELFVVCCYSCLFIYLLFIYRQHFLAAFFVLEVLWPDKGEINEFLNSFFAIRSSIELCSFLIKDCLGLLYLEDRTGS